MAVGVVCRKDFTLDGVLVESMDFSEDVLLSARDLAEAVDDEPKEIKLKVL